MNKLLRQIAILVAAVSVVLVLGTIYRNMKSPSTVRAVGDLAVDWGVPDGNPIFVVINMLPGDVEDRDVIITNDASNNRPVGVRGVETSAIGALKTVLDFVISEGGTDLYGGTSPTGPKTLDQFFTESGGPDGIFLFDLAPSETKTVNFKVTFPPESGNEFQATSVVFDLIIGIAIEVPVECEGIVFAGNPIFGTEERDVINGTNGNDLIFAFEGNDVVNSGNGDDCVVGGEGNDTIHNSNGNDVTFGNEGDDRINGSNGVDIIFGGSGNDTINGNNGDDEIDGGEGNDKINGGNGNDTITGGAGNDEIDGGNGNDDIQGNEGNDTLRGKNGNDTLIGGDDTDSARGDLGIDTCDAETEVGCEI